MRSKLGPRTDQGVPLAAGASPKVLVARGDLQGHRQRRKSSYSEQGGSVAAVQALHVGDRGLTFSRMRLRVTDAILIARYCPSKMSRKWEVAQAADHGSPPRLQAQLLGSQLQWMNLHRSQPIRPGCSGLSWDCPAGCTLRTHRTHAHALHRHNRLFHCKIAGFQ